MKIVPKYKKKVLRGNIIYFYIQNVSNFLEFKSKNVQKTLKVTNKTKKFYIQMSTFLRSKNLKVLYSDCEKNITEYIWLFDSNQPVR